jgi:hypothetical protein
MGFGTFLLCFSLRTGNLVIAATVCLGGLISFIAGEPLLGILDLCVGGIGVWAVRKADQVWLLRYFWMLATTLALQVLVAIFQAEMNRAEVRNQLEGLEGQDGPIKWDNSSLHDAYMLGLLANTSVWLVIGVWFLTTLHSYRQVLAMGFTGDEKLAPESLKCILLTQGKEVTETTSLMPA